MTLSKKPEAIIYCRVPNPGTRERSLDDQELRCRDHAQQLGFEVVNVIRDVSVGTVIDRLGVKRLNRVVDQRNAAGHSTIILAEGINRFSIDPGVQHNIRQSFRSRLAEFVFTDVSVADDRRSA